MMLVEHLDVLPALQSTLNVADSHFSLPSTLNVAEELRKTLKSEGDEFLDEILVFFPVIVVGGAVAAFGLEYLKNSPIFNGEEGFLPEVRRLQYIHYASLLSRARHASSRSLLLASIPPLSLTADCALVPPTPHPMARLLRLLAARMSRDSPTTSSSRSEELRPAPLGLSS